MSTFMELLPAAAGFHSDRRRASRARVTSPFPVWIGRGSGLLVDLGVGGARVRHDAPVALGAAVRMAFERKGDRFESTAEVLASRVAALSGSARFESRLRFLAMSTGSQEVLTRTLSDLLDDDLRRWVANLHGWNESTPDAEPRKASEEFIRCRYVNGRWQQRRSRDASRPLDGFTVDAATHPSEIRALCRVWEVSDEEGRRLVALITDAILHG